ncbi:hypothetical protein LUZ60_016588 [Juncus effusus]|nr:hypothetical protein LUZ60_016588 [Juncus effusus]
MEKKKGTDIVGFIEWLQREKPLMTFLGRRRSPDSVTDHDSLIAEVSPIAGSVVSRCARILELSSEKLERNFETEFPDRPKEKILYARKLLEYCCHKALHAMINRHDYLSDREFSSLTFDMMLAWEDLNIQKESLPDEKTQSNSIEEDQDEVSLFYENSTKLALQVDLKKTVGLMAFAKISPSCPLISDFITVRNLFDALTSNSEGRLHFFIYDKYLKTLDKVLKSAKNYMISQFASRLNLSRGEIVLAVEGNTPLNPVLQHVGISAWPGRLTLTTHALYFESIRVGNNKDKVVKYDLSTELKQVVKRELTGPLGARLFDKAILYNSSSLKELVCFEFPELKGHSRRDYMLEMINEILNAHIFIRRFEFINEIPKCKVLAKATLAIFRYIAIKQCLNIIPLNFKTTLPLNILNRVPKGDSISEALTDYFKSNFPPFYLRSVCQLGFGERRDGFEFENEIDLDSCVGCFGLKRSLQIALEESFGNSEKTEAAFATVDQFKVEGIDTNIILMKELLFPVIEFGKMISFLVNWEDPFISSLFLFLILFLIQRGWFCYIVPIILLFFVVLMLWHKFLRKRKQLEAFKIKSPPPKNPVEQIFILQDSISKLESILKELNIILLKLRALFFIGVPKATEMIIFVLIILAGFIVLIPFRHLMLIIFIEGFTRNMPMRKQSTNKFKRRFREWWARIPVTPVKIIRVNKNEKNS